MNVIDDLQNIVHKKYEADKHLVSIEHSIHTLETSYIQESVNFGNIIRGYDAYLGRLTDVTQKLVDANAQDSSELALEPTQALKSTTPVPDQERLFSRSSILYAEVFGR